MTDCTKFLEEKLREASCLGDIDTVRKLLASGVNVNSQNGVNGWSPLHWGACRNHFSIVDLLLKNGANKDSLTKDGKTPYELCTNREVQILLAGVPSNVEKKTLPITPSYLENPPLYLPTDINTTFNPHFDKIAAVKPANPKPIYYDEELVLKVRVADSKELDFIEIEILRNELTFDKLVEICCKELCIESANILKLRKLPNTIIRKDKDVLRLVNFQEIEVVLRKETLQSSSPGSGRESSRASSCESASINHSQSILTAVRPKYESISTNQNQTVLY